MKVTHIRRCHVCGTVNELENAAIHKCQDCGKYLAPFYYFEEGHLEGISEDGLFLSEWKQISGYRPIYGFSTYWSTDDSVDDKLGKTNEQIFSRSKRYSKSTKNNR